MTKRAPCAAALARAYIIYRPVVGWRTTERRPSNSQTPGSM